MDADSRGRVWLGFTTGEICALLRNLIPDVHRDRQTAGRRAPLYLCRQQRQRLDRIRTRTCAIYRGQVYLVVKEEWFAGQSGALGCARADWQAMGRLQHRYRLHAHRGSAPRRI